MKPQKILGKKFVRGKPYYKVKWQNTPKQQATWESPPALLKYKSLINKYQVKHWGTTLDQKFFDPQNYLTKGFPKKKIDKKEAKEQKRKQKKKDGSIQKNKHKESLGGHIKMLKKHQQSEQEGNSSEEQEYQEASRNTDSKYSQSSLQESQQSIDRKKSKKNRKKSQPTPTKRKQPSICVLDSETQENIKRTQGIPQKASDQQQSRKQVPRKQSDKQLLVKKIRAQDKDQLKKNQKPSDLVEIVSHIPQLPLNQQKQETIVAEQRNHNGLKTNPIAILDSSSINIEGGHGQNQQKNKRYDFNLDKYLEKTPSSHQSTIPKQNKQSALSHSTGKAQNFKPSHELSFAIAPTPAPKLIRMYHLEKIGQTSHLYLVEYSNGQMLKMNTSQMIQAHPEELVSFLQRKNKMKYLGI